MQSAPGGARPNRFAMVGRYFTADQLMTWPNLITVIRLGCIPVFLWLLFVDHNRAAAAWLLAALGSTDWVDGWIARRFDQGSDFGAAFDPIVDRLLFLVALPSLLIDGSIPPVVAVAALAREAALVLIVPLANLLGLPRIIVTWEGKVGTFLLMFAFPMFLGANSTLSYAPLLRWLAWLFAVPGLAYAWYAMVFQYLPNVARGFARPGRSGGGSSGDSPPSN